jgi:hypothetical protein
MSRDELSHRFGGLVVDEFSDSDDADDVNTDDPGGSAWRVTTEWDGAPFAEVFQKFLDTMDTTKVTALLLGAWGEDMIEATQHPGIPLLVAAADRFPALRHVCVSLIESDEFEISWIHSGDVTPLLTAFPALETLAVRGSDVVIEPVRHEGLRTLIFESGGLPAGVARNVGACDLPNLGCLEIWLGVGNYGGDTTVADLAGILNGERLPSLKHLGLMNSEIQDEIAAAVAAAPVTAQLDVLDLSMGVLTDAGAEALLAGQPLTHLKKFDLHFHFVEQEMADRVRAVFAGSGVELIMPDGEEPDIYDDQVDRFTEVGE